MEERRKTKRMKNIQNTLIALFYGVSNKSDKSNGNTLEYYYYKDDELEGNQILTHKLLPLE